MTNARAHNTLFAFASIASIASTAFASTACNEAEAPPAMIMTLRYGIIRCGLAGVARTQLILTGRTTGHVIERNITCNPDSDTISIETAPEDIYDGQLLARSEDDTLVYALDGDRSIIVRSVAGISMSYGFSLAYTTGDLTLSWTFESGEGCDGAVDVVYNLYDRFGDRFFGTVPCEQGFVELSRLVPGDAIVSIEARDGLSIGLNEARSVPISIRPNVASAYTIPLPAIP